MIIKRIKNKIVSTAAKFKRRFVAPLPPVNADGKVLIHLGCGPANDPRWINIDLLRLPHIHHIQSITRLDNFPDNTADLIYASHAFEHVSHRELLDVLIEWCRVLKSGGVLRLSVPDLDRLIHIYNSENKEIQSIVQPLMGTQDYQYNFHYSVFNKKYLTELFKKAGFKEARDWDPKTAPYHTFRDWSSRQASVNGHSYPVSLNLEAVK
ncbi:MAG: methyltransferase domain-containing protein [bacterium]|nr:methyltransferase domain-containing protein [bacterium]